MSLKDAVKSVLPESARNYLFERKLKQLEQKKQAFLKANPGDAYLCNMCGKSAGAFMPDGEPHQVLIDLKVLSGGIRENCRCPHCYSKDRDRLIWLFLQRKTTLLKRDEKKQLLHFAPEPVLKAQFQSQSHIIYKDADLDPMLASYKMDITKIPLLENSQDAILCNHVLEHIPDDALAMRELLRVLKPSGFAILQVPISLTLEETIEDPSIQNSKEQEERFGQRDHVRIYGKDYASRLENAGFRVQEIAPDEFLTNGEIELHGLLKEETIYYCTKP